MKSWREALMDFERAYWNELFALVGDSVTDAVRIAKVNRGTYYTHRRKYDLRPLKSPHRNGNAAWKLLGS